MTLSPPLISAIPCYDSVAHNEPMGLLRAALHAEHLNGLTHDCRSLWGHIGEDDACNGSPACLSHCRTDRRLLKVTILHDPSQQARMCTVRLLDFQTSGPCLQLKVHPQRSFYVNTAVPHGLLADHA